jgi:glyoxylase-like metal-dependent hydrolase (beta-lactamase superfamily II)
VSPATCITGLARFDIGEHDTLTAQLGTLGYSPADVDTAIVSHLHEDHIGGLRELTGAALLVSRPSWPAGGCPFGWLDAAAARWRTSLALWPPMARRRTYAPSMAATRRR